MSPVSWDPVSPLLLVDVHYDENTNSFKSDSGSCCILFNITCDRSLNDRFWGSNCIIFDSCS